MNNETIIKLPKQVEEITSQLESNRKLANDVKLQKYQNKAIITFIDDDTQLTVKTILKPLYDSLGIKGCVAVPTKLMNGNGFCTSDDLISLQNDGWNLLNHTHNHIGLATLTNEEDIRFECTESKRILDSIGANGSDIMVYPLGSHNAMVRKVVKENMRLGITVDIGTNYTPLNSYTLKRINSVKNNGANIDYDSMKSALDEVVAKGGWLIVMTHCWQDAWKNDAEIQKFKDFINYAKTQSVDFMTTTQALEYKSNVLDVGDNGFVVGRDGKIGGNNLDIKAFEQSYDTTVSSSTPVSYFKKGISTITYYSSAEAGGKGFPPKGYNEGTLITYRPNGNSGVNPDYGAYQTYKAVQIDALYMRHWIVSQNTWSAWSPVGGIQKISILAKDSVTTNNTINDFTTGTISICQISYSNTTLNDFPEKQIGELTTYKTADNGAYYYQTYKLVLSNKIYYRTWINSSSSWSSWETTALINKKTVTIDFGTINANSGKQINVPLDGIISADQLLIKPNGSLEECMLFIYSETNDIAKVRIFNYTSSAITVNRSFIITSIRN